MEAKKKIATLTLFDLIFIKPSVMPQTVENPTRVLFAGSTPELPPFPAGGLGGRRRRPLGIWLRRSLIRSGRGWGRPRRLGFRHRCLERGRFAINRKLVVARHGSLLISTRSSLHIWNRLLLPGCRLWDWPNRASIRKPATPRLWE